MLPIVYHPDYAISLNPRHRFPMSKYGYLRDALVARGLLPDAGGYLAPGEAGFSQIAGAHDPAYVDQVFNRTLPPGAVREIGLPLSRALVRRVRLSSAGTTLAGRLALEHGIACNMAGGSHHAAAARGSGYCVFNDVAVAARTLLDDGVVARVLVVDLDVHQGDGTARIFDGVPEVFTFSIHAARNFPVRKAVSDLDIGLDDGTSDLGYLTALREGLDTVLAGLAPDIVFYNAGVDPYQGDRLGRLALSAEGLRMRDRTVLQTARDRSIPVATALGGGYDNDVAALAARHAIVFEEAAALMAA